MNSQECCHYKLISKGRINGIWLTNRVHQQNITDAMSRRWNKVTARRIKKKKMDGFYLVLHASFFIEFYESSACVCWFPRTCLHVCTKQLFVWVFQNTFFFVIQGYLFVLAIQSTCLKSGRVPFFPLTPSHSISSPILSAAQWQWHPVFVQSNSSFFFLNVSVSHFGPHQWASFMSLLLQSFSLRGSLASCSINRRMQHVGVRRRRR